jgi:hypothetical protein
MKARKLLISGLLPLLFPALSAAVSFDTADVASVASAIDMNGPQAVIDTLWQDANQKTQTIEGIRSGQDAWLGVAQSLAVVGNPGQRFELLQAIGQALPANPAGVLGIVGKGAEFDEVCGVPLVEPTQEQTLAYVLTSIQALQSPLTAELEPLRTNCLELMLAIKAHHQ